MTSIQEVNDILLQMNEPLAKEWSSNDIIKMRIAMSYDDWIDDIDDHNLFLTLHEYIETCLDTPQIVDSRNT